MRKVGYLLVLLTSLFYSRATYAQALLRGQIIKAGSSVLDPNNDGFISQTNTGFSTTTNYWVPEFEIKMFGVPILGSGDVLGDNTGKSCGITDLIPDTKGYSVYAVKDAANNLIFRFRVGDNNPSVEAWTILLDTDGLFGANDPNATAENPGFEVDITMIKNQNFGVLVYNIDGISTCPTPVITYPLDTHFQISVADEASCGDPDYFYDFYVSVADLTSALGINLTTGVRIAAATNVSATCAMKGNIADISGVNNDDAAYKNCDACAFSALIGAQCPTEILNLCSTCSGFNSVPVHAPTINQPVRAGQTSISGTCDDGIYIVVQVFPVIVGTTNQWSTTPREVGAAYATGTNWVVPLTGALQNYDKIVATAQKDQNTPPCGLNGDSQSSTSVTVALPNGPPVAQNQLVSVVEDTPTAINLVATDPDSDPLTYLIVSAPTHGTLSGSGSSVTYTPNANYNGSDSFTFKVSDGIFTSNTATVTINVTPVNDPPVANSQSVTTLEDTSVGITLTGSDIEGSPLTYIIVTQPQHGTLTGSGASLTYTPAANYNGVDNFTFKVNDGTVDSNSNATVLITVTPVNDAPVANNQIVSVIEDTPTAITLSASDADGDPITYIVLTQPAHGTLSGSAPNLTYTPALNYNGGDSFTFKVNDGSVDSNTATVTITVTPVNDAPIANNQSVIVTEDVAKAITLTATDVDANALTYTVVTPPSHGTLSGSAPNLTYTPAANYNGSDSFTFKANDGTTDSNIATVSITVTPVNDAPVANDQTVSTPEDTQLGITLTGSDVDGNTLTYIVVTPPTHGTLSGSAPNLTYTPVANYNGGDSFTFKVNDGTTDSNTATVTITVTPVNDAPVANDQTVTVTEDIAKAITLTATDVDGNALTYTVVTPPTHGTLSGSAPGLTYTPAANYNGNDSFTFKANDGTVDSNIATVSITVTPVNDAPVADDQSVIVVEDVAKAITLTGSDVDGNTLAYIVVTPPTHGTLSGSAPNLTYNPAANYNGGDSFTFKVNDGTADSNIATVTITVTPVNDAPIANDQTVTVTEDVAKAITLTATDVDGNALTYTVVTPPTHGTLSGSAPGLTYTPAANYNGNDSFTFKANDGTTDSNIATVSITVTPVNDAPVADDQSVIVVEDVAKAITLTGSDVDGNILTYSVVSPPTHGTLSGSSPNLTYTPVANYNGGDSFTFKVNDGTTDSNTATVTITVTSVNDAPVANDQTVTVTEDIAKAITLTATDVDGNALTYTVVTPPTHGTLSGSAPGLTYTPAANYNGNDNFTFKANDGSVDSNIATVSITVTPVNDAPIANNQTVTTVEDTQAPITLTASDPEGDVLTYIIVTPPAHGTLSGSAPNFTYTPDPNYSGSDSFTFKANDGSADSNTATVSITITPVNDVPIANNQSVIYDLNTPKAIVLTGSDADGNTLTYSIVTGPTHGTLDTNTGQNIIYTPGAGYNGADQFTFKVNDGSVDSNIATVFLNFNTGANNAPTSFNQAISTNQDVPVSFVIIASDPDNNALTYIVGTPSHGTLSGTAPNLTYTPALNYTGGDSFTFKVNDGITDSNIATVTITVLSVDHPPVANSQSISVTEDIAKPITLIATDQDGNALSYSVVAPPLHGILSGAAPNLTYTPSANYNGNDSFTFKANDGSNDSNIATVSITITPVNDAPTTTGQTIVIDEDNSVSVVLTANDVDGDPLTYIIVTPPAHGTLTGSGATLTYTPAANYNGSDSFTFQVSDGTVNSNISTVNITVNPINDVPTANSQSGANNQTVTTLEDTPVNIALTASDVDNDPLTYIIVAQPTHGILSGSAPNVIYTPATNYNGGDSFTFKVNDGNVDSNIATVSITVTPVNDAPTTSGQTIIIDEDNSVSVVLTGNDVDGDPLTYIIVTPPSHGTLTGTGSTLTYTPAANYNGSDSFTFQVSDGTINSNISTVNITINPINDVPTANNQSGANNQTVTTLEDTPVNIALTASDVDNDPLTYAIVTPPAHGTLSGSAPNVTYTPAANYTGSDAFTFKVNDGHVDSNIATVSINVTPVNDPPIANNQSIITLEDTQAAITLSASDVDGNALTYILITSPAHGTLNGTAQSFTYTPAANYNGSDSFSFKVNDGTVDSNTATVSITVTSVDDSPIANSQSLSTVEDTSLGVTLTGSDIDSNSLTYSIVSPPGHGTITGSLPNITFVPTADYSGSDNFTFKISDGTTDSNIATIFINITPVNDAPVAGSQNLVTNEDTQLNILLTGTDADANAITFNVTSQPSHGTLSGSAPSFTYTPGLNFNGSDSFTFTVNDGLLSSNTATISILVNAINDPPISNDQSIAIDEDTSTSITLTATDVETNTLTYTLVAPPTNGTLTGSPPNLIYKPNLNYFGIDGFTFYVNDGTTNSNTATISITINPVNDAPTSSGQTVTVDEDNSISVALTGNDVDGDALTYIIVIPPAHGALTGSGANLIYTPDPNYNGNDGFSFEVNDGTVNSNVSPISIVVNPVNDVPTANNQSGANNQTVTTLEDTPVNIILTATDVDNDPLTYSISSQPTNGTLSGTPPNVLYTPDANYNGSDSFTFMANDGHVDSNIATVSINVTPVNDPPSISPIPIIYTLEDNRRLVCLSVSDVDSQVITFTSPGNLLGGGSMTKDAVFDFCYGFDPAANYNGRSTWTMGACDDAIPTACASINVEIRVTPVNDPPVAIDDIIPKITARADTTIDVLANDLVIAAPDKEFYDIYEADSTDVLTIDKVTAYNGTATITNNGKTILYQSDFDFEGVDSIRYRIHDSGKLKDSALVVFDVALRFHIYHGLSPNGDGKNDYWRIDKIDEYPGNTVRIFDRFNNLVFETHNYSNEKNNWTGQSNHGLATGLLPEDTYFYSVNLGGDKGTYSGYVVLKRH